MTLNSEIDAALCNITVTTEKLAYARSKLADARAEETYAINQVNEAQKQFDTLVKEVYKLSLSGTDWKLPKGNPCYEN